MAQKKKVTARVLSQTTLSQGIYDMRIETELAEDAKPGQFISVYTKDASKLLPRPISICEADKEKNCLRIVYRAAGAGTKEFATYKENETVEILGTLGNGFPLEKAQGKKAFLMGGGIGVPPIVELAKKLSEEYLAKGLDPKQEITAIVGYRNADLFLKEDLEKYVRVVIATEDGSVGSKGNVMDAIRENNLQAEIIYACGPMPMLRAIRSYAMEQNIPAYISLEERMACGVGACLGCVCKTTKKDDHSHVNNTRICTDGPVFLAEDVDI